MAPQLVWLITGTSSGLGRELTFAVLKRGDKVIATTRGKSFAKLADLKTAGADIIELDVTAPLPTLREIAKKAVAIHGRIDVLVNNAAYAIAGTVEDVTPEQTFDQYNTNVFGALNVARAFLPYMRERKSGTIVWAGSIVAWLPQPAGGIYSSTKAAIRGIAETVRAEIAPLGMRSICFDIGYFRTALLSEGSQHTAENKIEDYKELVAAVNGMLRAADGNQPGDPVKAGEVMVDFVRGEGIAAGKTIPDCIALGTDSYLTIKGVCEKTLKTQEEWKDAVFSTDFPKA